jgi:hypothetical protein
VSDDLERRVTWLMDRTSRNADRQKEQLESVKVIPKLTDKDVDDISTAGKGLFSRHFQHKVWDEAKP